MSAIELRTDGAVAIITMNRPHVRNALDLPAAEELAAVLDAVDGNPAIAVGILTGAGGTFCAGMDLKSFAATGQRPVTASRGAFGIAGRPPLLPLIAAVEGNALGGGLEVALACDLVVAAEDAVFGLPEVRRGLTAAAGGLVRLPRRIGPARAKRAALTGAPFSAAEGYEWGLISSVTEPGGALRAAAELASVIAANAPLAVRASKQVIDMSADWRQADAFALQEPLLRPVRDSDDAAEGARAFAEKRTPVWRGR
jgi:enoyl-CoA hydratase/carnithine racemase